MTSLTLVVAHWEFKQTAGDSRYTHWHYHGDQIKRRLMRKQTPPYHLRGGV